MAFDQSTRIRLQKFVAQSRAILTEEFTRQLQSTYGMDPKTGTIADPETLTFLDNQGEQTALILRETLTHYLTTIPGKSQNTRTSQTLDRIIREQAFTVLNRLSALRMAGARGFLIESIANGYSSKGFQLYKNLAGTALGKTEQTVTGDTYRQYLFSLFDEFSGELPVLFDRYSIQGRLFPRESALLALLEQINHFEIEHLWAEDETIGWIYQYFNSQEERKKMRAESQAPRNSRELAVRNQFFTPRYVVEFLTDNTLGRIWYEMTQGKTSLVGSCRYLVRRPNEFFLAKGEEAPDTDEKAHENLSQEELLKQPVYIPFRALKDPRELRMLDPACGSMHFGLYAFDLFERIYEEAWQLESELGTEAFDRPGDMRSLQVSYSDFDELKKNIPKLIIEHNIHGVDIDPRAVQIAGLSLWQRAHRAWHQMGLKPGNRLLIKKSNIVCAEPMPGEKEMLQEFTSTLHPPVLGQIVETIFDKMKLAGEAGTLLKIEEEIASTISRAKDEFNKEILRSKEEKGFLPGMTPKRQPTLFDFAELPDDTNFWDTAEKQILDALANYADHAESDNGQKRLFAEDAAKGFAFIDLCRKRFDVVLMNPPFGAMALKSKQQMTTAYPNSKNDLLALFVERGLDLLYPCGRIGAITSRTCFFLSSFQKSREEVVLGIGKPEVIADLGYGVMDDAMVEAAAYVLIKNAERIDTKTTFIRLLNDKDKADNLPVLCDDPFGEETGKDDRIFQVRSDSFLAIPGAPFAYWVSDNVREIFQKLPAFESENRSARQGLATADDFRFVRTWWEEPGNGWVDFAKGGAYSPFYADVYLMVNNKKEELSSFEGSVIRNPNFYFRPGLTWPRRTTSGLSLRILPQNCIFADKGPAIFVEHNTTKSLLALLSLTNSITFGLLISLQLAAADAAARSYEVGVIQKTPIPVLVSDQEDILARLAQRAWSLKRTLDTTEETSHAFILPEVLIARMSNYVPYQIECELAKIQKKIDDLSFDLYDFSKEDRLVALQGQKQETQKENDEDENETDTPFDKDQAADVLSWALGVVFGRFDIVLATGERSIPEEPEPFDPLPVISPGMIPENREPFFRHSGILPEDLNHPDDISRMLEKVLSYIKIEVPTNIQQWLQKDCFDGHLKRYSRSRRSAPIYWALSTSSGAYRLWVYYPQISEQTLYTCINDFVEPKLKSVTDDLNDLRSKPNRSSIEEKELAKLTDLEAELKDFRDELLRIAKFWKPNLNDGVQITAAPLWKLFQHRQWQKKLKETWEKLEKGEYDWAHLACSIWPERVLEKCHTDRSLAIAHDVEDDFWEEIKVPVIRRGKDTGETKQEWHPRKLSGNQLRDLIQQIIETGQSSR